MAKLGSCRTGLSHLGLQQTALKQNERLPPELAHELAQAEAEVLIAILALGQHAPGLLVGQALLEAAEDLDVCELALGEPGLCDDAQALAQHAERPGPVGDDHDGLLHRRPCHIGRPHLELRRVHLPRARDAEERGRGRRICGRPDEGEVGEVFGRAGKGAEGESQPSFLEMSLSWQGKEAEAKEEVLTHAHRRSGP